MKIDVDAIRERYELVKDALDERQRRIWAGAEAAALGHGGITAVAKATGMARSTIGIGRDEATGWKAPPGDLVRTRRSGAGPKRREHKNPALLETLKGLVEPGIRGDPESPLLWTCKSTRLLARAVSAIHGPISPQKVGRLLRDLGYSLQAPSKTLEGTSHPDRNAQFEHINRQAAEFIAKGLPVLSVDSKKKELVGEFKTGGREWRPQGQPTKVNTHDFIDQAIGKAIPYGVFDVEQNMGFVNVGVDHDTPTFAVGTIALWWQRLGAERYSNASEVYITADAGGSNSYRSRVWKAALQRLADHSRITFHVSHFPPGTSKWNKIEHRLFSFITLNWRGRPLSSYETIIELISATTTASPKALRVMACLDTNSYQLGESVSNSEMRSLALEPHSFHGEWNYTIRPRTPEQAAKAVVDRRPSKDVSHARWAITQRKVAASGLTLVEYCRREGLSYDAIRSQRCRLKREAQKRMSNS